jgi:hypothetical protein
MPVPVRVPEKSARRIRAVASWAAGANSAAVREWALPAKGKNVWFRGCIRRPMDILLGQRHDRRTRRAAASREACQFHWTAKGKGKEISLLASLNV